MSIDPTRDLRLVVADDDPRVRVALDSTLSAVPGIDVVATCALAAEVAVQVRVRRPDVVLVDVQLPDATTGLTLLADLARAGVPAVAMSWSGGLRARALAAGAVAFVEKDGAAEALVDAVLTAGRP